MEFCICAYCGEEQKQQNINDFTCEFCREENSEYLDARYYPEYVSEYYEHSD
jgi:hypothetical protein